MPSYQKIFFFRANEIPMSRSQSALRTCFIYWLNKGVKFQVKQFNLNKNKQVKQKFATHERKFDIFEKDRPGLISILLAPESISK